MSSPPPTLEPPLFPRPVQAALAVLCGLVVLLLLYRTWQISAWANRPLEILPSYPVELNSATLAEFEVMPGIGPTLAGRIVAHREARGGFGDVAELLDVPGIGPMLFDQLKERVRVGLAFQPSSTGVPGVSSSKLPAGVKLDPNTARADELTQLPGIGKVLAARIVEARAVEPFRSIDDLDRVKGIGKKTLDAIRPNLRIGP